MRAWLKVFTVIAALLFYSQPASAEDCTLKQYASLDLEGLPNEAIVQVTVDGHVLLFLVDTGAVYSTIFDDVAKKYSFHSRMVSNGVEVYSASGNFANYSFRAEDFEVGAVKIDSFDFLISPRDPVPDGIDGILGPDFLSKFDLDFDFAAKKLNLFSLDHCSDKVVYWADSYTVADFAPDGPHIKLPIILDGRNIDAILDTGSTFTNLTDVATRQIFDIDDTSPGAIKNSDAASAEIEPFTYRFGSLSIGGLAVSHPLIHILHDEAAVEFRKMHSHLSDLDPVQSPKLPPLRMMVGMDILTKLHFYISFKDQKIYATVAGGK